MKGVKIELSGKTFGRLTVLNQSNRKGNNGQLYWRCKCKCGKELDVSGHSLRIGHSISCGCAKKEWLIKINSVEGYDKNTTKTSEYNIWKTMRQRCRNTNSPNAHLYVGKGIKVCKRWDKSFINFINDMGKRPSKLHSIERKNSNKNYCPSNCKWGTDEEQSNNTSRNVFITYNGERKTLAMWAKHFGINYYTLAGRLRKHNFIFSINGNNFKKTYYIRYNGKKINFNNMKEFCARNNLTHSKIYEVLNNSGFYGVKNNYKGYSRV